MIEATFAIPGDIATPTGGYAYDREILRRIGDYGISLRHLVLPDGFPFPSAVDLEATARRLEDLDGTLLIDGLAFGALPASVLSRIQARIVALVHHPLALETGLSPDDAGRLRTLEREALTAASAVIVTSDTTAAILVADYDVPREVIAVALPGTMQAGRAKGSGAGGAILAVGSVIPRKGYEVLVAALARLRDRPWALTIVGALDRAPDYVQCLRAQIDAAGLSDRIRFTGAVSDHALPSLYGEADIFVLASHFEGYGMVLTEALAHGLPIVSTRVGAATETLSDEVILKVMAGDPIALGEALASLLDDGKRRRALAEAAISHAQHLPDWSQTVAVVAAHLKNSTT
ncbi:glycosyltransferase family 4 protein [Microvirga aerophila]|uniref:Glycosyl transferase n=1 Tax=Microvirga aerophila TaxID=670291 RepID=A0A512BSQ8_9HYPH|nr:glycosyltransferase family 4 protein [Microvirga aerophila]GEO14981.1 glycosyl transferase [Microvirga aerophila]